MDSVRFSSASLHLSSAVIWVFSCSCWIVILCGLYLLSLKLSARVGHFSSRRFPVLLCFGLCSTSCHAQHCRRSSFVSVWSHLLFVTVLTRFFNQRFIIVPPQLQLFHNFSPVAPSSRFVLLSYVYLFLQLHLPFIWRRLSTQPQCHWFITVPLQPRVYHSFFLMHSFIKKLFMSDLYQSSPPVNIFIVFISPVFSIYIKKISLMTVPHQ